MKGARNIKIPKGHRVHPLFPLFTLNLSLLLLIVVKFGVSLFLHNKSHALGLVSDTQLIIIRVWMGTCLDENRV